MPCILGTFAHCCDEQAYIWRPRVPHPQFPCLLFQLLSHGKLMFQAFWLVDLFLRLKFEGEWKYLICCLQFLLSSWERLRQCSAYQVGSGRLVSRKTRESTTGRIQIFATGGKASKLTSTFSISQIILKYNSHYRINRTWCQNQTTGTTSRQKLSTLFIKEILTGESALNLRGSNFGCRDTK